MLCVFAVVFSYVDCLQSKQWICIVLCLCCLLSFFVTRLSGFLVCILWSCFLFCCFGLNVVFLCFFSPLKKGHKETDTANPPQKCRKKAQFFQFAQLCSRIMFLIFWCGLKMLNFAENTIKSGFSIFRKGQKWPKDVKKVESTIGPSMLRTLDQSLTQKSGNFALFCNCSFFLSHSPCRRKEYFLKDKWKLGPIVDSKKAMFGPIWPYNIYIYAVKLKTGPRFPFL